MLIVKICSGLGNQMYQYAFLLALRKHFPEESIRFDDTVYAFHNVHQGFELDKYFELEEAKIEQSFYRKMFPFRYVAIKNNLLNKCYKGSGIFRGSINRLDNIFGKRIANFKESAVYQYDKDVFSMEVQGQDIFFEGYWQNINYYVGMEQELKAAFDYSKKMKLSDADKKLLDEIENSESVGIHIRRGDYVNNPAFDLCSIDYYEKAIKYLTEKTSEAKLYFFTDDKKYVEENYYKYSPCVINHNSDSGMDMYLMSKCKHNIIANSSFSFWGAFLNENVNKIVVAPKYVYRNKQGAEKFSLPETWYAIDNLKVKYEQ